MVNKFIPWDFDPDKVAKVKLSNIGQFSVRMMLPFTVRCNSCGEFMYAGKKFNTRKENANGEDYLGIPIQRFYFKCVNCGAEFAIKTDPKNSTYVVESGATRNSNIQLNERQQEMEDQRKKEEAESMDAIKALENRTEEMKREMDIYDSLDLVLAQTRKTMNTDPEDAIDILRQREERKKKKEEEAAQAELENKDKEEMQEFLRAKKEEEIASKEDLFANAFAKRKELPKSSQKRDSPASGGVKVAIKKKKKVVIPMQLLVCCHSLDVSFAGTMSVNQDMYSLFADNGDVVYIEDEWEEGKKKEISLPFCLKCSKCEAVMKTNTVVEVVFRRDEENRRIERLECSNCKEAVDLVFDDVDELMMIQNGVVLKHDDVVVSDNEMIDTDSSDDKPSTSPKEEHPPSPEKSFKVIPTAERPKSFSINGMTVTINSKRSGRKPAEKKKRAAYRVCCRKQTSSFGRGRHLKTPKVRWRPVGLCSGADGFGF